MNRRYYTQNELRQEAYYERKNAESGHSMRACMYCMIGLVVFLLLAACFSSCTTTKVIEVQTVKHDTTYISKIQKDSVWLHDSIHVKEKGDSVIIEKWHTKWRDRLLIDTLYQSKTDTIPKPYPVIKEVERELTWWQKTQMIAGDILLAVIFGLFCFGIWKLFRKLSII